MNQDATGIRMLAIDAAMRRRFYADAPAALARRNAAYFVDLVLGNLRLLVCGALWAALFVIAIMTRTA